MARIPDRDEYRRRWASLELADRRRIVRAVNRGHALDNGAHAALAVMTARGQKRFWSKAWLLGPVSSLLVFLQDATWQLYVTNALLITAAMGAMSLFWYRRADRAEQANLEVAQGKRRKKPKPQDDGRSRSSRPASRGARGSHTPRKRR